MKLHFHIFYFLILIPVIGLSQGDESLLTIDRIYNSREFVPAYTAPIHWTEDGDSYVSIEYTQQGKNELVKYNSESGEKNVLLSSSDLEMDGIALRIADFSFSDDESKILIFTNTSRVWRANTKGDYYVYDFEKGSLKQIGARFTPSSLMFAKFSADNEWVGYVQNFNLYVENYSTGEITQLTHDGDGDIINGTFDWVYEEEFGCRDGFRWSPDSEHLAFWQLDASTIGTHYMINNIDSIYSVPVPLQYPKVGDDPSSCKVGYVNRRVGETQWIDVPGDPVQHYIPGIQWINEDELLIQQLNRKQNNLKMYKYNIDTKKLSPLYNEIEDTWVDIYYPDATAGGWEANDLNITKDGKYALRMVEDDYRTLYKIDLKKAKASKITSGIYDVASVAGYDDQNVYFMASPSNSTQRYLFKKDLSGKGLSSQITPSSASGINKYNISPNGKFAFHTHTSALSPSTTQLISLPNHSQIRTIENNDQLKENLKGLSLPSVEFFSVPIGDGYESDGRMILPPDFDKTKKYPVIFHVYGEPWGAVAQDAFIGMWNIMLAQKGYIVIDMDNRGTPCLKGSNWRKSIYRNIGVINSDDQATAAKEVLTWGFIDEERTAVWGWSGGGSMTLNQMFRYPEIYKTGISVAPVSYQLVYDNIYQERYMGLPQENMEDFINGSPISHSANLEGNLLLIHGTADDNVHYQSAELLINELIKHNKQFDLMSYPNRSHGIWEGENTTRHLYTLMTEYLLEHVPVD